jgi:DNA-binding NarL/FixJ family response regulator
VRLDAALRSTPCVLLTAAKELDAELAALDAGADAFVHKDQDVEVILAKLQAALRVTPVPETRAEMASLLAPKRILTVDDNQDYRELLAISLRSEGYEVIAARSGEEALAAARHATPDIVLLDLRMPGADGLACLSRIRKQYPEVKVVVLSVSTDENVIQTVLKRGASAFIVKSINPIDLPSALRQAVDGTVYSAIGLPDPGESAARAAGLTERETAILSALARGLSNEAIGKELWVAEQTVKFHLTNIYRKLNVANRTEAARFAYQQGLVESPLYESE